MAVVEEAERDKRVLFDSDDDEPNVNPRRRIRRVVDESDDEAPPKKPARLSEASNTHSMLDDFASSTPSHTGRTSIARSCHINRPSIASSEVAAALNEQTNSIDDLETLAAIPEGENEDEDIDMENNTSFDDKGVVDSKDLDFKEENAEVENKKKTVLTEVEQAAISRALSRSKNTKSDNMTSSDDNENDDRILFQQKIRLSPSEEEALRSKLNASLASQTSPMFREYVEALLGARGRFKWPLWLEPTRIRDAENREPLDPNYDPSTLKVPNSQKECKQMTPDQSMHFTPAMAQYWSLKSKHFDKLMLFKVGKFYEFFYVDAVAAQRALDLKWMGSTEKPHVGFPEQALHQFAERLIARGFQIAVVEQMETPQELAERNANSSGPKDSAVKREVCEVFTQGTLTHESMLQPHARVLLALTFAECKPSVFSSSEAESANDSETRRIGVVWTDVSTCRMFAGELLDGRDRAALLTLLSQLSPAEIVFSPALTPSDVLKLLKNLKHLPALSSLSSPPDPVMAEGEISLRFPPETPVPRELVSSPLVATTAALLARKLENSLIVDSVLPVVSVRPLTDWTARSHAIDANETAYRCIPRLVLDSACLQQLEVLESSEPGGSLLELLDHTVTAFGKRVFRAWTCAPLADKAALDARLDSVEFLVNHPVLCGFARKKLEKLPDLERSMARIMQLSRSTGSRKAVYFGDVSRQRVQAFVDMLRAFKSYLQDAEAIRSAALSEATSASALPYRLNALLQGPLQGGLVPDVAALVEELLGWVEERPDEATGKIQWEPVIGHCDEYDAVSARLNRIVEDLEAELTRLKEILHDDSLKFVHSKFKFEVHAAEHHKDALVKKEDAEITSTVKGFIRVHTETIKELIQELEIAEQAKSDSWFPFLKDLFDLFLRKGSVIFPQMISCAAELDCLLSLALASIPFGSTPSTRPQFIDQNTCKEGFVDLCNGRHPVLAKKLGDTFVPNSVRLGLNPLQTEENESDPRMLLVTGANMGGKSTVLRQTALCILMAQIGCFVPADSFTLTPFDRIFSRVGARDSLLEGKSTFYVELEETAAILKHASPFSLAIVDELGRGTSTLDGTAIALATLEGLVADVKCLSLFATHYHILADQSATLTETVDSQTQNNRKRQLVANYHMSALVEGSHIAFLYSLNEGPCPRSHGLHVARMAGILESVLDEASKQSSILEKRSEGFNTIARLLPICRKLLADEDLSALGDINQVKTLVETCCNLHAE